MDINDYLVVYYYNYVANNLLKKRCEEGNEYKIDYSILIC